MGFKFRRSVKIAPGVKINLSNKGAGVSVGGKGARVSVGPSGTRFTSSIPGTGLSYEKRLSNKNKNIGTQQYSQAQPTTYEVNTFQSKDNKINTGARKLMKPFFIISIIASVISALLLPPIYAIVFVIYSFFCYKNFKIPHSAVCPGCNKENTMLFKRKKIKCLKCRSTLIIKNN
ncbi:DUF4236 domain-containing protein [Bacillus thuringiensis]|uniref:DUF4236 domain-containing protein n=1 Tax=Bacillus thuringiensis TaxID=1428 RepID=UPI00187545DB|nr:DUF4236 domain-containing protein [Bacillus thuringiensis]MBE5087559.1 DUF4236 domain-containing protein [Bacillus thuringiensis]